MSMIDEKLSIIEMDIDLILSFYGELIARGGVYIALQGIDETKKGFIEKLISRRNWGKEVYTSIKRIEKSNFRKETISTFHENLIKSFENASSDENEYILFCNEEIKKSVNVKINYKGKIDHDKVINILKNYDLFCLFTKGENFCYAIHEALSAGLPILISDKTPWHKLHEYNAGWEIPLEKPELINKKILEYYNKTDEEKLAMHKGALQYATDVSNDKQILEDNIKMFESIIGGKK